MRGGSIFEPSTAPKCSSCHTGQSQWTWAGTHFFARLQAVGALNEDLHNCLVIVSDTRGPLYLPHRKGPKKGTTIVGNVQFS